MGFFGGLFILSCPPAWPFYVVHKVRQAAKIRKAQVEEAAGFEAHPTFGSAHFKTDQELEAFFDKGEILAGFSTQSDRPIYYTPKPGQRKPIVVFGGMGSGKTSSVIIPFLLKWKGSVLLFTSTYEDAAVALDFRRRLQNCSYINPTGENEQIFRGCRKTALNPIGTYWMGNRKTRGVRASKISAGKVPSDGAPKEIYWQLSSREVDRCLTLCEVELFPDRANIPRVARRTLDDPIAFMKWAYPRLQSPEVRDLAARWIRAGVNEVRSVQEVIQNLQTHVEMFVDPIFGDTLRWDLMRMGSLRQVPQTLVIANPLANMGGDGTNTYNSSVMEWAIAEFQSTQFAGNVPVAIVIDELAQYPKSEALKRSLTSLRKFGCFPVLGINDYSYLTSTYGKEADAFINNAGLSIWLQAKSKDGSEHLSGMLGEREVETYQKSSSFNGGFNWDKPTLAMVRKQMHVNHNYALHKQPLLLPHEVRELGGSVVFMDGVPGPILAEPRGYFKIPWLKKLAGKNPFWRG